MKPGRPQKEATKRALERVRQGETCYRAALAEDLAISTVYTAWAKVKHEGGTVFPESSLPIDQLETV
jgi:hypothetical protein